MTEGCLGADVTLVVGGRNMFRAMELIRSQGAEKGDHVLQCTAERMIQLMQCLETREWTPKSINDGALPDLSSITDNFRAHPKVTSSVKI